MTFASPPAPKLKAAKRKKSLRERRPAVTYSVPLHAPDASASVALMPQAFLPQPDPPELRARLLVWLVIGVGCFVLLATAVLFLTGRWEP